MVNPGLARVFTQVVLTGGRIFIRAVGDAYKVAAANAAVNAASATANSGDALTRLTGMTLTEAQKILDVEKTVTKEEVIKKYEKLFEATGASFYLQSKVYRAKERIELEMQKGTGSKPDDQDAAAKESA